MIEIKRLREKDKLTQGRLALQIKVSQSAIAKWKTGDSKPRAGKLPELAQLLNCTIDDLLKPPDQVI